MPITFKDITLIDYIKKYNLSKNKSYNLLINMNLTNVQELIDYLTIHPEDYTREFIKIIDYANNTLEKINNGENTSKIYEIPSKLTTKEFINFNNTCDKSTSADNLIMFNLTSNDYLKTILNDYNIYYIKYLLNHYNYKGENALVVSLDSFGIL